MLAKLLLAFKKYRHHLLFILAVVISLLLISNSKSSQFRQFRQTITDYTSFLRSPISKINQIRNVSRENEILREQLLVTSLEKETLLVNEVENKILKEMLDFKRDSEISLVPALVINMGMSSNLLSVTIDVGSDVGITENCPVMTPTGIIGKISTVGNKTSIVQLINDPDFRVGVRILPSAATGILRWKNNNICEVKEVYKNVEINVGDIVVSSGLSDIFPADLPIGKVSNVNDDRSQFQKNVSVHIEERLGSLIYVFVVLNKVS